MQGGYTDMKLGYPFFKYFNEELPQLVKANFPGISQAPEDTFIAGNSQGGYGALKWAFVQPGRCAAVASLSGVIDMAARMEEEIAENGKLADKRVNTWGSPEEMRGTIDDIPWLIDKVIAEGGPLPKVYVGCGTEDFLYEQNAQFNARYKDKLDLTYAEEPGKHEWAFWDKQIQRVLDWLPLAH
jgi:S-formylglutathione hydrolase FrmB